MVQRGLEPSPGLECLRGKVIEARPSRISVSLILFPKDFHVQNIRCATIFKDVTYLQRYGRYLVEMGKSIGIGIGIGKYRLKFLVSVSVSIGIG